MENKLHKSKILTCSAKDYLESIDQKLNNFTLVGVISRGTGLDEFINGFPDKTVAVTDFRAVPDTGSNHYYCYLSGTALVPKSK